jgi:hypothetical protein
MPIFKNDHSAEFNISSKKLHFFLRIVAFFKNWQMAYDLKDVVYALYQ